MSTPFSQTVRSLNADRFRPTLIGLAIALALLSIWCSWFWLARITFYETSHTAQLNSDGRIVAEFLQAKLSRIRQGQHAWLYLHGVAAEQVGAIAAIVTEVSQRATIEPGQVTLFALLDNSQHAHLPAQATGRLEIEVEYLSPAHLVMRTTGLLVDTPKVSLSPQSLSQ